MVALKSINILLQSQFDLLFLPEYPMPASNARKSSKENSSRTTMYVPIYEGSQFWICYDISPPHPPSTYFYFKMFIDGAHIVSWGCGEEDEYEGKTMFALFERERERSKSKPSGNPAGGGAVERRCFFFPLDDERESSGLGRNAYGGGRNMEVKVYRANARRRTARLYPKIAETQIGAGGVKLCNSGKVNKASPQRYYQYALLDPLDQPFASFRWLFRSMEELRDLGIRDPRNPAAVAPQNDIPMSPSRATILSIPHSSSSSSQKSPGTGRPRSLVVSPRKGVGHREAKRLSHPPSSNLLVPEPLKIAQPVKDTGNGFDEEKSEGCKGDGRQKVTSLRGIVTSALRRRSESTWPA